MPDTDGPTAPDNRPSPIEIQDRPELDVVIPLLNEENILQSNADALAEYLDRIVGPRRWRFIFVDNGSTDSTPDIIENIVRGRNNAVHLYAPVPNYGLALRTGLSAATAKFVHMCDIEQWDIPFLAWSWSLRDQHDLFVGSRRSDPTICHQPALRRILSWGLNALIQLLFGYMGTDTHGPKLLSLDRLKPIVAICVCDRGQYDSEIILRASRACLRIAEAPIAHEEHRPPRFSIVKKIIWNVIAFNRLRRIIRKLPYGEKVHFNQFSRSDVLTVYHRLGIESGIDLSMGNQRVSAGQ